MKDGDWRTEDRKDEGRRSRNLCTFVSIILFSKHLMISDLMAILNTNVF